MNSESKENLQAELVIIGGGGAGLGAAIAASETGVKNIIVLESRRMAGGNSALAMGPFTIGKPNQKMEDLAEEVDKYLQISMNYTHWKTCPIMARKLIEKAGDFIPWLENMGVTFEYNDSFPGPPYRIIGSGRGGHIITKAMIKKCEDTGVKIRCQTRARELILDKSGKMAGVAAEENGNKISITTDNVIIATGGFAGNKEMLRDYFIDFPDNDVIPLRGLPHEGDGILMAKEIGAGTDGLAYPEISLFLNLKSDLMTRLSANPGRLWINRRGERFTNESLISPEAINSIYRQPGKVYYSIFDEQAKKIYLDNPRNALQADIEKDLRACIADDRAKITNTLDEMAVWLNVPPDALKGTVNEYNACCDKGHDIFLKDKKFLLPLRTPPFYGFKCGVSLLVTHGDLKVDHNMTVLDKQDYPIHGLYAVGDDICGVDSDTYNINLPGHSLGFAINSGRIAGEHVGRSLKGF